MGFRCHLRDDAGGHARRRPRAKGARARDQERLHLGAGPHHGRVPHGLAVCEELQLDHRHRAKTASCQGRNEPEKGKIKPLCPSAIGGKSWNQSAYSPRTGWVYVPVLEICNDLMVRDEDPQEGRGYSGGNWVMSAPPGAKQESYLAAFDPATGKRQWSVPATTWLMASVLATAGDLIFSGDPEGNFFALDARHGRATLELCDRGGTSRIRHHLFGGRKAIHRDAVGLGIADRTGAQRALAGNAAATGVGAVRVCAAAGGSDDARVGLLLLPRALPATWRRRQPSIAARSCIARTAPCRIAMVPAELPAVLPNSSDTATT